MKVIRFLLADQNSPTEDTSLGLVGSFLDWGLHTIQKTAVLPGLGCLYSEV